MTSCSDEDIAGTLRAVVDQRMRSVPEEVLDLPTALPWLWLVRRMAPTPVGHGMLLPSVCLLVQGEKELLVGHQVLRYGAGWYVQAGMAVPVSGQVSGASRAAPYYGIRIDLDPREISDAVLEMGGQLPAGQGAWPVVTVERADDTLLEVFVRLLRMLDRPRDLPVLGRLLKQELIYRLLTGPGGASLASGAAGAQRDRAVGEAINWIRTHYNRPLSIEALARAVHMSASVLHRRFKAATVMSPLQYQKQVRLLEARKLLMSGKAEAANVAYEVGYESPSQFSREYRRLFGAPPLKDIEQLRALPSVPQP